MENKTKNLWSIPCKKSIVDEQTKLVSLIDIIERIIIEVDLEKAPREIKDSIGKNYLETPIQLQDSLIIASYWAIASKDRKGSLTVETKILDHKEKQIAQGLLSFETKKELTNQRTFVTIPILSVGGSGVYKIISKLTSQGGKVLSEVEIPIIIELNIKK